MIVFFIGYFFGKHVQEDKDQSIVYNALKDANYNLDKTRLFNKKSTDWTSGKVDAYQTILSYINDAFFGKH